MKKTLTEERVLKQLGIQDFRHMTKECIVEFASQLPYMEPEVAKQAMEQFPSFKDMASDLISEYRNIIETALQSNEVSQKAFYDGCAIILDSLKSELLKEDIQKSDRERIEDKMLEVARMIGEKDSENKNFIQRVAIGAGIVGMCIIGAAVSLLGGNTHVHKS